MKYPSRWSMVMAACLLAFLCMRVAVAQQNWPQWRGPLNTGAAPEASPPVKWSESENVKWKVKILGRGTATPIVWGDKIFIQTAFSTGIKPLDTEADGDKGKATETKRSDAPRDNLKQEKRDDKQNEPSKSDAVKSDEPTKRDARSDAPPGPGPGGRGPGRGGRGGFGGSPPPKDFHHFLLLCLDRATGKTLWERVARDEVPHEGHHQNDNTFASHSPVTDGEHIYAYFGSRGLHCFDMQGNHKWSKDLGRMQTKLAFGEGSSPALHGNTIVVNWDHEGEDFIAAFDKRTGKELWRQPRDEETTWSTPLIVEHNGQAQVITGATKKIRSYDLATGKQLWDGNGLTANVIPSPVSAGDMVYLTSGFRGAALVAVRLGATGNIEGSDAVVWRLNKATPYVPSPLLYENRLYFFSGNNAVLSCYNAKTGEPIVEAKRIEGLQSVYASPVAADGRVYLVGRNGTAVVIKHAVEPADSFETLSVNKLDEEIDASPVLVGSELLLRGKEYLYSIAEK